MIQSEEEQIAAAAKDAENAAMDSFTKHMGKLGLPDAQKRFDTEFKAAMKTVKMSLYEKDEDVPSDLASTKKLAIKQKEVSDRDYRRKSALDALEAILTGPVSTQIPVVKLSQALLLSGSFLMGCKEYATALRSCYERALSLLATEAETVGEKRELWLRAMLGKPICQARQALVADAKIRFGDTLKVLEESLNSLEFTCNLIIRSEEERQESYWLLYNGSRYIIEICRVMSKCGYASHTVPYLGFCSLLMESAIPLLTADFLPWRVSCYSEVCYAFEDIGELEKAEKAAIRALTKVAEISRILDSDTSQIPLDKHEKENISLAEAQCKRLAFKYCVIRGSESKSPCTVFAECGVNMTDSTVDTAKHSDTKGTVKDKVKKTTSTAPKGQHNAVSELSVCFEPQDRIPAVIEVLSSNSRRVFNHSPPDLDIYSLLLAEAVEMIENDIKIMTETSDGTDTDENEGNTIEDAMKRVPLDWHVSLMKLAYNYENWSVFEQLEKSALIRVEKIADGLESSSLLKADDLNMTDAMNLTVAPKGPIAKRESNNNVTNYADVKILSASYALLKPDLVALSTAKTASERKIKDAETSKEADETETVKESKKEKKQKQKKKERKDDEKAEKLKELKEQQIEEKKAEEEKGEEAKETITSSLTEVRLQPLALAVRQCLQLSPRSSFILKAERPDLIGDAALFLWNECQESISSTNTSKNENRRQTETETSVRASAFADILASVHMAVSVVDLDDFHLRCQLALKLSRMLEQSGELAEAVRVLRGGIADLEVYRANLPGLTTITADPAYLSWLTNILGHPIGSKKLHAFENGTISNLPLRYLKGLNLTSMPSAVHCIDPATKDFDMENAILFCYHTDLTNNLIRIELLRGCIAASNAIVAPAAQPVIKSSATPRLTVAKPESGKKEEKLNEPTMPSKSIAAQKIGKVKGFASKRMTDAFEKVTARTRERKSNAIDTAKALRNQLLISRTDGKDGEDSVILNNPTTEARLFAEMKKNPYKRCLLYLNLLACRKEKAEKIAVAESAMKEILSAMKSEYLLWHSFHENDISVQVKKISTEQAKRAPLGPPAPMIVRRSPRSVTVKAQEHFFLKHNPSFDEVAVYGKPTSAAPVSLSNTAAGGLGVVSPKASQITVSKLVPNESYQFAILCFDGFTPVNAIGTKSAEVPCCFPLPLSLLFSYVCQMCGSQGLAVPARDSFDMIYVYFVDVKPERPIWAANPLDVGELNTNAVLKAPVPVIRSLARSLFIVSEIICADRLAQAPKKFLRSELKVSLIPSQLLRLRALGRLCLSIDCAVSINSNQLVLEAVCRTYSILIPLLEDARNLGTGLYELILPVLVSIQLAINTLPVSYIVANSVEVSAIAEEEEDVKQELTGSYVAACVAFEGINISTTMKRKELAGIFVASASHYFSEVTDSKSSIALPAQWRGLYTFVNTLPTSLYDLKSIDIAIAGKGTSNGKGVVSTSVEKEGEIEERDKVKKGGKQKAIAHAQPTTQLSTLSISPLSSLEFSDKGSGDKDEELLASILTCAVQDEEKAYTEFNNKFQDSPNTFYRGCSLLCQTCLMKLEEVEDEEKEKGYNNIISWTTEMLWKKFENKLEETNLSVIIDDIVTAFKMKTPVVPDVVTTPKEHVEEVEKEDESKHKKKPARKDKKKEREEKEKEEKARRRRGEKVKEPEPEPTQLEPSSSGGDNQDGIVDTVAARELRRHKRAQNKAAVAIQTLIPALKRRGISIQKNRDVILKDLPWKAELYLIRAWTQFQKILKIDAFGPLNASRPHADPKTDLNVIFCSIDWPLDIDWADLLKAEEVSKPAISPAATALAMQRRQLGVGQRKPGQLTVSSPLRGPQQVKKSSPLAVAAGGPVSKSVVGSKKEKEEIKPEKDQKDRETRKEERRELKKEIKDKERETRKEEGRTEQMNEATLKLRFVEDLCKAGVLAQRAGCWNIVKTCLRLVWTGISIHFILPADMKSVSKPLTGLADALLDHMINVSQQVMKSDWATYEDDMPDWVSGGAASAIDFETGSQLSYAQRTTLTSHTLRTAATGSGSRRQKDKAWFDQAPELEIDRITQFVTYTIQCCFLSGRHTAVVRLALRFNELTHHSFAESILKLVIQSQILSGLSLNVVEETKNMLQELNLDKNTAARAIDLARQGHTTLLLTLFGGDEMSPEKLREKIGKLLGIFGKHGHYRPPPPSAGTKKEITSVIAKYEKAIELLRTRRERELSAEMLTELGDLYLMIRNSDKAMTAWVDSLDQLFCIVDSPTYGRNILDADIRLKRTSRTIVQTKGVRHSRRATKKWLALEDVPWIPTQLNFDLLESLGLIGCLSAAVQYSKILRTMTPNNYPAIADFEDDTNTEDGGYHHCRIELALTAAACLGAVFTGSISHPQRLVDFAGYVPKSLWPNIEIFGQNRKLNPSSVSAACDLIASILIEYDSQVPGLSIGSQSGFYGAKCGGSSYSLWALPACSIMSHVGTHIVYVPDMCLRSKQLAASALIAAGLLSTASNELVSLFNDIGVKDNGLKCNDIFRQDFLVDSVHNVNVLHTIADLECNQYNDRIPLSNLPMTPDQNNTISPFTFVEIMFTRAEFLLAVAAGIGHWGSLGKPESTDDIVDAIQSNIAIHTGSGEVNAPAQGKSATEKGKKGAKKSEKSGHDGQKSAHASTVVTDSQQTGSNGNVQAELRDTALQLWCIQKAQSIVRSVRDKVIAGRENVDEILAEGSDSVKLEDSDIVQTPLTPEHTLNHCEIFALSCSCYLESICAVLSKSQDRALALAGIAMKIISQQLPRTRIVYPTDAGDTDPRWPASQIASIRCGLGFWIRCRYLISQILLESGRINEAITVTEAGLEEAITAGGYWLGRPLENVHSVALMRLGQEKQVRQGFEHVLSHSGGHCESDLLIAETLGAYGHLLSSNQLVKYQADMLASLLSKEGILASQTIPNREGDELHPLLDSITRSVTSQLDEAKIQSDEMAAVNILDTGILCLVKILQSHGAENGGLPGLLEDSLFVEHSKDKREGPTTYLGNVWDPITMRKSKDTKCCWHFSSLAESKLPDALLNSSITDTLLQALGIRIPEIITSISGNKVSDSISSVTLFGPHTELLIRLRLMKAVLLDRMNRFSESLYDIAGLPLLLKLIPKVPRELENEMRYRLGRAMRPLATLVCGGISSRSLPPETTCTSDVAEPISADQSDVVSASQALDGSNCPQYEISIEQGKYATRVFGVTGTHGSWGTDRTPPNLLKSTLEPVPKSVHLDLDQYVADKGIMTHAVHLFNSTSLLFDRYVRGCIKHDHLHENIRKALLEQSLLSGCWLPSINETANQLKESLFPVSIVYLCLAAKVRELESQLEREGPTAQRGMVDLKLLNTELLREFVSLNDNDSTPVNESRPSRPVRPGSRFPSNLNGITGGDSGRSESPVPEIGAKTGRKDGRSKRGQAAHHTASDSPIPQRGQGSLDFFAAPKELVASDVRITWSSIFYHYLSLRTEYVNHPLAHGHLSGRIAQIHGFLSNTVPSYQKFCLDCTQLPSPPLLNANSNVLVDTKPWTSMANEFAPPGTLVLQWYRPSGCENESDGLIGMYYVVLAESEGVKLSGMERVSSQDHFYKKEGKKKKDKDKEKEKEKIVKEEIKEGENIVGRGYLAGTLSIPSKSLANLRAVLMDLTTVIENAVFDTVGDEGIKSERIVDRDVQKEEKKEKKKEGKEPKQPHTHRREKKEEKDQEEKDDEMSSTFIPIREKVGSALRALRRGLLKGAPTKNTPCGWSKYMDFGFGIAETDEKDIACGEDCSGADGRSDKTRGQEIQAMLAQQAEICARERAREVAFERDRAAQQLANIKQETVNNTLSILKSFEKCLDPAHGGVIKNSELSSWFYHIFAGQ